MYISEYVSKCCGAKAILKPTWEHHDPEAVCTCYAVCSKCNKPCDLRKKSFIEIIIGRFIERG